MTWVVSQSAEPVAGSALGPFAVAGTPDTPTRPRQAVQGLQKRSTLQVAHKTGWINGTSHDAAIVYPAGRKPRH